MISESLTITEAAKKFDIPKSTLYERIRAIKDDEIQNELNLLLENNKERFGPQK